MRNAPEKKNVNFLDFFQGLDERYLINTQLSHHCVFGHSQCPDDQAVLVVVAFLVVVVVVAFL